MHGPYLKRSQTGVYNFSTVRKQPAVDGQSVATATNKVPYVLLLERSPLQFLMMHSSSSPAFNLVPRPRGSALPFIYRGRREIFMHILNIQYMAASRHTHVSCNAVLLVSAGLTQAHPTVLQIKTQRVIVMPLTV